MAAIATGTAVEGAGQGFMGLLDCLCDLSVPLLAAVNGVAVGLGFTVLAHCDLVLVDAGARLRVPFAELGVPPEAASSVLFPAAMGWQRAARVLLTSDWVTAPELVELGLALEVCAPGTVLDETVALATRIAGHPRAATRAITSLLRAARRDAVLEANRREQAAFARLLGGAVGSGTLAEFAGQADPDRAPRHHRRPDRPRRHAGRAGRRRSRSSASTRSSCPSTRTCPSVRTCRPALVDGVRLDDYKRCLDPLVALATAAAVTERIGLGTGILLAAQHDPILLAKQVATLDHLSGGRVTLGVGYRMEPGGGRGPRRRLRPSLRRRARAPGGHGGHLVERPGRVPRRVRRLRPDLVVAQAGPAAPCPHAGRRGRQRLRLRRRRFVRRRLDPHRRQRPRRRHAPPACAGRRGRA